MAMASEKDSKHRSRLLSNMTGDFEDPWVVTSQVVHHMENPNYEDVVTSSMGSSVGAAIFNFTNCIIGAGAIGLGGAIAVSGGLVSIASICFFAVLTKISLDMVICMGHERGLHTYEDLATSAFWGGRTAVVASKFLYSFGCLVAYIVVVKDNLGDGLRHLLGWKDDGTVLQDEWITVVVCVLVVWPLCLLRDMTPLSSWSIVSVVSMFCIVGIVIFLFMTNEDHVRETGPSFYEDWVAIKPGILESLGTFVFSFVSQHTAHLTFDSLKPELRTVSNWKRVSTWALTLSTIVSLSVGVVVYMTFWENTQSDMLNMYPALKIVDLAKLLLCVTMLLTFPLPFFTCRELLIASFTTGGDGGPIRRTTLTSMSCSSDERAVESMFDGLQEPLLLHDDANEEREMAGDDEADGESYNESGDDLGSRYSTLEPTASAASCSSRLLLPEDGRQLKLPYHVILTTILWGFVTLLAISAPSLGAVLDLVGCASGTLIAFVLPALIYFKLHGYGHMAALILVVGGVVGSVGTFFSLKRLVDDPSAPVVI